MKINMNLQVKVILTSYGKEVYKKYHSSFNIHIDKAPDELIIPLWEVGGMFGSALYNGNPHMVFVDNNIEFIF